MCRGYDDENFEVPTKYKVPRIEFDVPGWRALCEGFLTYVRELDLTDYERHINHGGDEYILRGLHEIEHMGATLVRTASFLIDIRPDKDDLYISSICLGDIGRDPEEE